MANPGSPGVDQIVPRLSSDWAMAFLCFAQGHALFAHSQIAPDLKFKGGCSFQPEYRNVGRPIRSDRQRTFIYWASFRSFSRSWRDRSPVIGLLYIVFGPSSLFERESAFGWRRFPCGERGVIWPAISNGQGHFFRGI
jgi:hypothetical protein